MQMNQSKDSLLLDKDMANRFFQDIEQNTLSNNQKISLFYSINSGSHLPSPDSSKPKSIRECLNCKTSNTSLWRRSPKGTLCNACSLFYKLNGKDRPLHLRKDNLQRRPNRSKRCLTPEESEKHKYDPSLDATAKYLAYKYDSEKYKTSKQLEDMICKEIDEMHETNSMELPTPQIFIDDKVISDSFSDSSTAFPYSSKENSPLMASSLHYSEAPMPSLSMEGTNQSDDNQTTANLRILRRKSLSLPPLADYRRDSLQFGESFSGF